MDGNKDVLAGAGRAAGADSVGRASRAAGAAGPAAGLVVVLACYGSAHAGGLDAAYGELAREVAGAVPGARVELAVVSAPVRRELEAQGEKAAGLGEVLGGLAAAGVRSVVVQPVLVAAGRTLDVVRAEAAEARGSFERLTVGEPLVAGAEDEVRLLAAVAEAHPVADGEALLLVAHGVTPAPDAGDKRPDPGDRAPGSGDKRSDPGVDLGVVTTLREGAVAAVARLREQAPDATRVVVVPLMLVAGAHVRRELAGDAPKSWRAVLVRSGYAVDVCTEGLLTLPAVRRMFVDHALRALEAGGMA